MYYQKSVMTQVKEELMSERPGEQINVGDIASKVSTMWKSLDSGQREVRPVKGGGTLCHTATKRASAR